MVLNLVEEWKLEIMTRKTLIAYFSATGNTAAVAKSMATATGSDIYEIRPSLPYTIEDLDWTDRNSRSSIESDDVSSRPSIADPLEDMSQYDAVMLGFPIWWYVEPRIIDTFLGTTVIRRPRQGTLWISCMSTKLSDLSALTAGDRGKRQSS